MKNKIVAIFVILVFSLSLTGCGCKTKGSSFGLKLEIWGVNNDSDAYGRIFEDYTKINPKIKEVIYRKFSANTYKQELLEALASGKGPDIFMINSTWEPSFQNKIVPAPKEVISEKMYRDNFVDLVSDSFIVDGEVYAVPLSADSLSLYYNKELFAEAGIVNPPKTWTELVSLVPKLTEIDSNGNILHSAIAMGTVKNINRPTDILSLLMIQGGTNMVSEDGNVVSFSGSGGNDSAKKALDFYTDFARRSASSYTWNPSMHLSLDAFAEGRVAMMLNYSWHMQTIKNKAPKLNFTVAPVPQMSGYPKVTFGNCYGYVVALNKDPVVLGADPSKVVIKDESRIRETWKFLRYLTLSYVEQEKSGKTTLVKISDPNSDPARKYLENTNSPAARKDLIEDQKGVYELGVFAEQNLFAKNWKQINPEAIESIMGEMIDDVNRGRSDSRNAIRTAVSRINQVIKK